MAFTQSDLDALDAALAKIGSGVQSVRFADGKTVVYRSAADIIAAREKIQAVLERQSGTRVRQYRGTTGKGT